MAMNKIPTLILGIGGIGCRIAATINDLLGPEDREHIAIIGMDTNVNDLNQLANRGIRTIQTSDDRTVGEYLQMHPEYMSWFPVNQFTIGKNMINGAGQIRAVSRLAALASEENGKFIPISEEIQRIRENRGQASSGNMTVMVVGSITGGTGAGLFLQMPFYIRRVLRSESNLNIIIRGMFVGPDLTADVQPSKVNRDAVRVNGYTCLKELNAMYMLQTQSENVGKLKVDFYEPAPLDRGTVDDMRRMLEESEYFDEEIDAEAIRTDATIIAKGNPEIPYDYLYLIEKSALMGTTGNAPLECVEGIVARMVHTLMFTPVSDNALSVEDNMVLQDMEKGGMNRYSSAGLSRLVFPVEKAREYVTLCSVRDLVRDEWMIIDESYKTEVVTARNLQQSDGQVEIPRLQDSYLALYKEAVSPNGSLSRLYKEAFRETTDNEIRSKAEDVMGSIAELVEKVVKSAESKKIECAMRPNEMNAFDAAGSEADRVYEALGNYGDYAKRLVEEKPASIANEIFPPNWQTMKGKKDSKYNIYGMLYNVHPLTARFLCYDMLRMLEEREEILESALCGVDLREYKTENYGRKGEDKVTAAAALQKESDKGSNPLIKLKRNIFGQAGDIADVKRKLKKRADGHATTIETYLSNGVELGAVKILIERLKSLLENYYAFFQTIGNMIKENETRIQELEKADMPWGQIGVYCSKDALQSMTYDYRNGTELALPEATKTAIFEQLFKVLSDEFDRKGKMETERQKVARAAKKTKVLNTIFQTAVVDTIRTDVARNGAGIVDLTIYQALEKQYELDVPENLTFEEYLRAKIEEAMRIASPMLATSSNAMAENTETVYIAMHPSSASTEDGEPSTGATQKLYAPQACAATDGLRAKALLDDSFSPYEIICFKARYKFSIEDLVKYGPNSDNAKAYNIRIANLGKRPPNTGDPDAFKTVVNPHLDRYWHEEAYLPAIYASERRRNRENIYKAFIYAIGLDMFVSMTDESVLDERGNPRKSWYFDGSSKPVKVRGGRVSGGYIDLYRALPFNGRIKMEILKQAEREMSAEKGSRSAQELMERILETDFIADLIQPSNCSENSEENILDILLGMRDSMQDEEWALLFIGLREAIWEFCARLLDKNERMVNDTVKTVMARMYANCKVGAKDQSALNYGERELKKHVETIAGTVYRRN